MKLSSRSILLIILTLAFTMTFGLRESSACGPFSRYAIFSFTKHPDLPLDRYSSGELGIVQASYARSYLFVAYKLINGEKFSKDERSALSDLWNERLDYNPVDDTEDLRSVWIKSRSKVPGLPSDPKIDVYRARNKDDYDSFLNCTPDAFKSASATLDERIAKYGASSQEIKDWATAQDQVFSKCGEGQVIPDTASASAPATLQADRAYQIAAAHFYSMNFDEARSHFERIAGDSASQWHDQAPYLIARTLIRKASLGDESNRAATLSQAETQLKTVLSSNLKPQFRQSALGLLALVELRLHPEARIREIAQSLLKKEPNLNLKQSLIDYTLLLDRYTGDSDQAVDENLKRAFDASEKDDLTDWILTFQSEAKEAFGHSVERWEKSRSTAWLIASLSKLEVNDAAAAALISAAEQVPKASPAYATAQFHLARLSMAKGDKSGARARLDTILSDQTQFPLSTVNQLRHQRMLLATSFEEFLKYALRVPASFSWDEDGRELPINVKDDEELKSWHGRSLFDSDSTTLLNKRLPLSMLRDAASNKLLPEHIRRQVALAAWVRAVVLGDSETGKSVAPVAAALAPELKSYLDAYTNASTHAVRQNAALYAILKFPGLRPLVEPSTGRLTPIAERDIYRDNWWCDIAEASNATTESSEVTDDSEVKKKPIEPVVLEFLSEAESMMAEKEYASLGAAGTAPNYLSKETIEWANRSPRDSRVAEALHIAVTSTRYGCTDKGSPKWSKAVFDVLHKKYPNSVWAKKTPYWFKEI